MHVLILVLMEDTLRVLYLKMTSYIIVVLILVLMEDTLRVAQEYLSSQKVYVLILVLMEDTLREQDIRILCISGIGIYKTNNACSC